MKKEKTLFKLSCVSFVISALSVLLTFVADYKGNAIQVVLAVMTGVLFWAGLIAGMAFLLVLNSKRRKDKKYGSKERGARIGLISFFENRAAMVFDCAMALFFILMLLSIFIPGIGQNVTLVLISLLLASACMHSMLNGLNYRYIKSVDKECRK